MTKKELIEKMKDFPDDAEVLFEHSPQVGYEDDLKETVIEWDDFFGGISIVHPS